MTQKKASLWKPFLFVSALLYEELSELYLIVNICLSVAIEVELLRSLPAAERRLAKEHFAQPYQLCYLVYLCGFCSVRLGAAYELAAGVNTYIIAALCELNTAYSLALKINFDRTDK